MAFPPRTPAVALAAAVALSVATALAGAALVRAGPDAVPPELRVDQLGFAPDEVKRAYLLSSAVQAGAAFSVADAHGRIVLRGRAGPSRGRWNERYGAVQPLDLSSLRAPGRYRVRVSGAESTILVARRATLFTPRVEDAVAFFQAQRDGHDVVPGPLHRRPAHLRDRHAVLYDWPRYESADSDVIVSRSLRPLGGAVDLEGGWVDAGDFIKFTHTSAYAETLLLAAARALGRAAPPTLAPETRFGLRWLAKAWHPARGVMYMQVGIGSGNKGGTFNGDHDLWRLPERDDALSGAVNRYLRTRPAFRANAPGTSVPPNLAGRFAAAFALAAQVDAEARPARARAELATAGAVFAAAKTENVRPADVVTALPHAFYPESSWHDDLELAGAELALAGQALGDSRADEWLQNAARWARAYLTDRSDRDTLNLYDTSALAHADLVRALRAGDGSSAAVSEGDLLADLRAQLERGRKRSARDPFRAGVVYDDFDGASHAFGLVATERLYRGLTGDGRYAAFATAQRDWALGANPWGVSLMIGVGSNFARCPQHVVANLSGRLDGHAPVLRGAVVNGPNDASLFSDGLGERFEEMRPCPRAGDAYAQFTGRGSRFVDDVRSWQTVEPAVDFTAGAALAFAMLR